MTQSDWTESFLGFEPGYIYDRKTSGMIPTIGRTHVVVEGPRQQITSLRILDLAGREFARNEGLRSGRVELPLEGIAGGVYLIEVELNGQWRHYEKVVVASGN